MNLKTLEINPEKCNGCGDCITACESRHSSEGHTGLSCIHVIHIPGDDTFFLPTTCHQCEDPPCLSACPNEAIYRDDALNRVMIDHDRCVGCRMCFSACPFGAVEFDAVWGKSVKCDLCGGDLECVHACKQGALVFTEPQIFQNTQMLQSALRTTGVVRHMRY